MRRQTTKQPSGAATTARPKPNSRARRRKGCSTMGSPHCQKSEVRSQNSEIGKMLRTSRPLQFLTSDFRLLTFCRTRRAGQVVAVVVLVPVKAEGLRRLRPEQAHVFRMPGHRARDARAADVTVEADDAVAL